MCDQWSVFLQVSQGAHTVSYGFLPSCSTVVLGFQHRCFIFHTLTHTSPFEQFFSWKTMQSLCTSSKRSCAIFLTAVLVLIIWLVLHQWEIVDDQRVRLGHAISEFQFTRPSSNHNHEPPRPSPLPLPSDSSRMLAGNLSARNSTLGVSLKVPLSSQSITNLPSLNSSPKSSP